MRPADLAEHRERRQRQQANRMERDLARLLPRLATHNRMLIVAVADQARDPDNPTVTIDQAHAVIRRHISRLDRQAA